MTDHQDLMVRAPLLAVALWCSEQIIAKDILRGRIPPPDSTVSLKHSHARIWRLSTVRDWNPNVAARCQALLHTLESLPKDAA